MPGDIILSQMYAIKEDHKMYIWFLGYKEQQTEFFKILDHCFQFYHLTSQKSNFE